MLRENVQTIGGKLSMNTVKVKNMETGEEKLTEFNAESVKKVIKGE